MLRYITDAISYKGNSWGQALISVGFEFILIALFALVLYLGPV